MLLKEIKDVRGVSLNSLVKKQIEAHIKLTELLLSKKTSTKPNPPSKKLARQLKKAL
jgi:hypothetical protein